MKKCPICQAPVVEGAHFCHMCGIPLKRLNCSASPISFHTAQTNRMSKKRRSPILS